MSSPLEATKSLLRTCIRTFYPNPKQTYLFDALLTYGVLNADMMVDLFPGRIVQQKEVRMLLNPLKLSRLVSTGMRSEVRVGTTKSQGREYYYVNYHEAVDAIKYRIVKLQERVQNMYNQADSAKKDWSCKRCGAEYDELSILDKYDPSRGFYCDKCGTTLDQNEAAVRERGDHAKIRMANDQLRPFNALLAVIDAGEVPENDFETAWTNRRELRVEDVQGQPGRAQWRQVERQRYQEPRRQQATVDEKALGVTIEDAKDKEVREAEAKRSKARAMAEANVTPAWIAQSTVTSGPPSSNGLKKEEDGVGADPLRGLKKEEEDNEKKPVADLQAAKNEPVEDDEDEYVRLMLAEQEEEKRRAEAAAEADDDDDEEFDDEEDDDDFEDAGPSPVGTPMSSPAPGCVKQEITPPKPDTKALKRELDLDGDSVSGTSTGANTPVHSGVTALPDAKRIKLENGTLKPDRPPTSSAAINWAAAAADSDEDEDFEDV